MLNDEFGARLLALLTSLGWGDAKNGQIPNLEILTRPLATLEVQLVIRRMISIAGSEDLALHTYPVPSPEA